MEPDTNTQQIPPIAQQPPIQPPTPGKHTSPILLWLFIIALVGVASYFGYQNWQLKQQISQAQPTPILTQSISPKPTTNWQSFSNTKLGFGFKYPENWELISDIADILQLIHNQESIVIKYKFDAFCGGPGKKLTGTQYELNGLNKFKYKIIENNQVEIGITDSLSDCAGIFTYNQKPYSITLKYPATEKDNDYEYVFDQILSTFKFTNAKSEIPSNINKIFTAVNQVFGSNIAPTKENQFYSLKGFVNRESWKLDVSSLLTDKSHFTILFNTLEKNLKQDINSAADGIGQSVQGYENDQIYCFLLRGFNASDYISCVEK